MKRQNKGNNAQKQRDEFAAKLTKAKILTERPDGMPYETYVELRRAQTKSIRNHIRG